MDNQQREFKGIWIPREIWLDTRLNALDKIIFAEIDSYSNGENGCYAGNEYLANFCQCSESKVSKTISKLIKLGYVRRISFDGRNRILQSCLANFTILNSKKNYSEQQNMPAINILNNPSISLDNITPNPQGEEPNGSEREDAEPTFEEEKRNPDHEYCKTVMDLFSRICTDLSRPTKASKERIRAVKRIKKDVEEYGGWEKYFTDIQASDYLTGKVGSWSATFDWVIKTSSMVKIIEGNYRNKPGRNNYSYRKEPESMQKKYEALKRQEEELKASGEYVESEIPF